MACIGDFIGSTLSKRSKSYRTQMKPALREKKGDDIISASELAAAEAEIWMLKRNIADAKKSLQELEIMKEEIRELNMKQMNEIREVQLNNAELHDDLHRLRDAHTVEKNALLRQLHALRMSVNNCGHTYEKLSQKNRELKLELRDAHEKIYMVGIKFLKLKAASTLHPLKTPSHKVSVEDNKADSTSTDSDG